MAITLSLAGQENDQFAMTGSLEVLAIINTGLTGVVHEQDKKVVGLISDKIHEFLEKQDPEPIG